MINMYISNYCLSFIHIWRIIMKKIIRRVLATVLITALFMSFTLTAGAAVKTMPDGGTFDPAFYAATYPDVAAAFGTDENLLYQHYVMFGKTEGRLPYAAGAPAAPKAAQPAAPAAPAASFTYDYRGIRLPLPAYVANKLAIEPDGSVIAFDEHPSGSVGLIITGDEIDISEFRGLEPVLFELFLAAFNEGFGLQNTKVVMFNDLPLMGLPARQLLMTGSMNGRPVTFYGYILIKGNQLILVSLSGIDNPPRDFCNDLNLTMAGARIIN